MAGQWALLAMLSAVALAHVAHGGELSSTCPDFSNGTWAVGELRNFESESGEPSRMMDHFYENKTPRACCDACSLVEGCKFWTWIGKDEDAVVGDCSLFKSFACEKYAEDGLPLISNKLARTGADVCHRPETLDPNAPIADKKDAAIAEMKAALNAQLAVREEESTKWEKEVKEAEAALAAAERQVRTYEAELQEAQLVLAEATKEVEKAQAVEKVASDRLESIEETLIKLRAKVGQETAFAEKAREEYGRANKEISATRMAKVSSDNLVVLNIASQAQEEKKEIDEHPYGACPQNIQSGEWAVGLLRNLGSSKLPTSAANVIPRQCCTLCAQTADCKYWSWEVAHKHDIKGKCSLFRATGCTASATGLQPFRRNTKLGRVGIACSLSSQ